VRAILPVDLALIDQLQVRHVDEGRCLQRVLAPLAREVARRDDAQLVLDDRDQPVQCLALAVLSLPKQARDLRRRGDGISVH
jgi:hypothetical protein